jgi:hypothetical protein
MQWALLDDGDVVPSSLYEFIREVCAHNARADNDNALVCRVCHYEEKKKKGIRKRGFSTELFAAATPSLRHRAISVIGT